MSEDRGTTPEMSEGRDNMGDRSGARGMTTDERSHEGDGAGVWSVRADFDPDVADSETEDICFQMCYGPISVLQQTIVRGKACVVVIWKPRGATAQQILISHTIMRLVCGVSLT